MDMLIHNNPDEHYRQARKLFDQMGAIPIWNDNNQDISAIFNIFQELSDGNYGKAFYPLSRLYYSKQNAENGEGQTNCLAELAFEWCLDNKSTQDVEVWCDLGRMYDEGYGVEQNDEEAAKWYRLAAESGNANAQQALELMYANGRSTEV